MKIIYSCFGGSHSSVTAAAIHLGMLPTTRVPTPKELLEVPYFEQQVGKDHGYFRFMGLDEYKNEVYIIGKQNLGKHFEEIIRQIADIFNINQDEIIIIDSMPYVNYSMMIGGFTSRKMGITCVGRPIVIRGTQKAYFNLVNMVDNIKITLASRRV